MSSFEPSDWKKTKIPRLSQLDSLQRCLICKDFLRAPVTTSCNHTFCSQCIRQHLLSVNFCPLCKTELFESNLKRAILLEEIVLCYQAIREDLIATLKTNEVTRDTPNEDGSDVEVIEVNELESDGKRSTSSTPNPESKDAGLVSCPVCNKRMKASHLQGKHLDYCLNGTTDPSLTRTPPKRKANDVSSFFRQKQSKQSPLDVDHEHFYFSESHKHNSDKKKLPKVDFASLSTSKVKEKLASLKLPTSGSRQQLELRYNHYYLLHNSNLDSNHSVSEIQLRQKLNQWEKSHQAFSTSAANSMFGDQLVHKSLSDKDFPVNAWLERYKDEFRDLVRSARRSRIKKHEPELQVSQPASVEAWCKPVPAKASVQEPVHEESQNPASEAASRAPHNSDDEFDFRNSTLFS